MFSLAHLLPQAATSVMQPLGSGAVNPNGEIVISGRRDPTAIPPMEGDPAPPPMGNRSYIEEARAAGENAPKRKGMFGTKGTLRDVLGVLGDAFLVQSGNDPMYAPARQREKMGDAMSGFTESPEAAMAAIERMAQVDPAAAQQMYQQFQQEMIRKQQAENAAANNQSLAGRRDAQNYSEGVEKFGQLMRAANPETYPTVARILGRIKDVYGLGEEFHIPEAFDPDLAEAYATGGTPRIVQSQERIEQGDRRLGQADQRIGLERQRVDIARQRANRPPAGRNPTDASMAQGILDKIRRGGTPTAGEAEVLDRLGYGPNGKKRGSGGRSAPPPPPNPKYKGWSAKPNQ